MDVSKKYMYGSIDQWLEKLLSHRGEQERRKAWEVYLPDEPLGQAGLVYQIEALTCYGGKTTYFTCVWIKMLWQVQCCLLDGLSMSVLWRATSWKYRERGGQPIRGLRCENMGGATSIYQTVRRIVSWWTAARWCRFTMLVKNFPGKFWSQLEKQNWCSRLTPREENVRDQSKERHNSRKKAKQRMTNVSSRS